MTDLPSAIKISDEEPSKRLAVLIDADNAQPAVIEALLEEVALFGDAIVRRIYGDFTLQANATWKTFLNQYSIKAIQQFAYTTGKNATDSTMIIDAMDLLYTRRLDGFCLVTSDSDNGPICKYRQYQCEAIARIHAITYLSSRLSYGSTH